MLNTQVVRAFRNQEKREIISRKWGNSAGESSFERKLGLGNLMAYSSFFLFEKLIDILGVDFLNTPFNKNTNEKSTPFLKFSRNRKIHICTRQPWMWNLLRGAMLNATQPNPSQKTPYDLYPTPCKFHHDWKDETFNQRRCPCPTMMKN